MNASAVFKRSFSVEHRARSSAFRAGRSHLLGLFIVLLAVWGALTACSDETQRRFSSLPAFLRLTPVSATPVLRSAVSSPGSWCLITYDARQYQLAALGEGQTSSLPRTALEAYGRPLSVAGFLVGIASVPAFDGTFPVVAYDAVCPVCYNTDNIERRLAPVSHQPEQVLCPRCSRTYDLANGGIPLQTPSDGRRNTPLFRYRAAYHSAADVFVVQN